MYALMHFPFVCIADVPGKWLRFNSDAWLQNILKLAQKLPQILNKLSQLDMTTQILSTKILPT